uniref:Uncharacterized protein n=1 Tax=Anguilla anguilla TaxID=7936 RepID=A0A0E9TQE0_ANGAN
MAWSLCFPQLNKLRTPSAQKQTHENRHKGWTVTSKMQKKTSLCHVMMSLSCYSF